MTPEGYEKQKVKKFLDGIGAYHFWPVQTGFGKATIDCLGVVRERFFGIEVKKRGYVPSDFTRRQRIVMQEMRTAGGATFHGDANEIIEHMTRWLDALK